MDSIHIYTTEEVLKILKISKVTLYKLIKEGKIKAKKVGRSYRFLKSELENFLSGETSQNKTPESAQPESVIERMDSKAAAQFLGIHEAEIKKLAVFKKLKGDMSTDGTWFFYKSDLENFKNEGLKDL